MLSAARNDPQTSAGTCYVHARSLRGRSEFRWLLAFTGGIIVLFSFADPALGEDPTPPAESNECPADGKAPQLSVDLADCPLVINDTLREGISSFTRNVRLTATGGDDQELRLLAPDLQAGSNADKRIDRSNITIPAGTELDENQPRDVPITVSNVTRPGDYTGYNGGELRFLLPGQAEADALRIPIRMSISPEPDVVPLNQDSSFQLARSGNVGSLLERILLPRGMDKETLIVQFDNRTPAEVPVTSAQLVLQGERTGFVLGTNEYDLQYPNSFPADEVSQVRVEVNRSALLPDRYRGALRLRLEDLDDPVSANLAVDVRDPPLWPLIVVLLGIVVGRSAVKFAPPTGAPVAAAPNALTSALEKVAGTPQSAVPPAGFRAVRALLFILLLVLLALLGWQQLYINNGANFGVGGLLDYLGLFLWGLSADVAQRTLQNLG
jgi:hypothetical protein